MEEKTPMEALAPVPAPTPAVPVKQPKRGSRASHSNEQVSRSPAKPATLLPRPSTGKPATILPQPAPKPVIVSNQMTPLVPKPIASNGQVVKPSASNATPGFTTYLVVDGNQGQLVQVANDGPKPVTFRNQAGQILQATPITVMPSANQSAALTTSDPSALGSIQSQQTTAAPVLAMPQSVATVQPISTTDVSHTANGTAAAPQQLTATSSLLSDCGTVNQPPVYLQTNPLPPTSILNGSSVSAQERDTSPGHHDNDSSIDDTSVLDNSTAQDPNLSLSLSQIVRKTNHRHRRASNSSASKKKRGRPRLYERDPFTNKPIKSRATLEPTEITLPTMNGTTSTLLMPGPTGTITNLHPHANGGNSLIFPTQSFCHTTTIPVNVATPSLLQQQPYTYPSLLNGGATPSTSMLTVPTLNILSSNTPNTPSPSPFAYSSTTSTTTLLPPPSRPFPPPVTHTMENQVTIPLKNLQISSTSSPTTSSPRPSATLPFTAVSDTVPLNPSPIKSLQLTQTNDVVVHYIGGFVIRESSQPFPADDPNDISKDSNHSNSREKENHSFNDNHSDLGSDQLRCIVCKKVDFSERFFNQEKKLCSKACSTKPPKASKTSNGKKAHLDKPTVIHEQPPIAPAPPLPDPPVSLPPDHGLPADPSRWTVAQVGQFIGRLTNALICETFCESEMDGQALLLMTPEHLRDTMKIKLGPSLVISSEITKLRERARAFS